MLLYSFLYNYICVEIYLLFIWGEFFNFRVFKLVFIFKF